MEDMEKKSNCTLWTTRGGASAYFVLVNASELERLKKRFMKLDRYAHRCPRAALIDYFSDASGSIDRDEFLQIPQIASNPLASRMIAIFDEESVNLCPAPVHDC